MATTLTPLGISVLALLGGRPMHPYEIYRLLADRHEDRVVKVRPGSLYHTVDRLAEHALIEAVGTERDGGRPERTTYRITAAGRAALTSRIRAVLATPASEFPVFLAALAEAHTLPRREVVELLTARVAGLEIAVAENAAALGAASSVGCRPAASTHPADSASSAGCRPPVTQSGEAYLLAGRYVQELLTTELTWLRGLIGRLERKEVQWPLDDRL